MTQQLEAPKLEYPILHLKGQEKRNWIRTHPAEVSAYLREFGFSKTLGHFNIRYPTLCRLLDLKIDDPDNLLYMRGGQKSKWLRAHGAEVLDYLSTNGIYNTLVRFHIGSMTLDRLLNRNPVDNDPRYRFTRTSLPADAEPVFKVAQDAIEVAEIAKLEAARSNQGVADLRREIRELKEQFSLFQDTVGTHISKVIIKAFLEGTPIPDRLAAKPQGQLLSLKEKTLC